MRHNKKFNHLGRTASHRSAMLANMAISLIMHKRITTTVAKAKALKKYVEPLITKSKEDSTNSRRVVFSYLQNKEARWLRRLVTVPVDTPVSSSSVPVRVTLLRFASSSWLTLIPKWQRIPRRSQPVVLVSLLLRLRPQLLLRLPQLRRQRQRLPLRRLLLPLKRQRQNKQQTSLYKKSPHPSRCGFFV